MTFKCPTTPTPGLVACDTHANGDEAKLKALGDLFDKNPAYSDIDKAASNQLALEILNSTYVGKLLAHAAQRLEGLSAEPPAAVEDEPPVSMTFESDDLFMLEAGESGPGDRTRSGGRHGGDAMNGILKLPGLKNDVTMAWIDPPRTVALGQSTQLALEIPRRSGNDRPGRAGKRRRLESCRSVARLDRFRRGRSGRAKPTAAICERTFAARATATCTTSASRSADRGRRRNPLTTPTFLPFATIRRARLLHAPTFSSKSCRPSET